MKQAIFLLAFIVAIASAACTGGQDNSAMKNVLSLIEKSMKQRGAAQLLESKFQRKSKLLPTEACSWEPGNMAIQDIVC